MILKFIDEWIDYEWNMNINNRLTYFSMKSQYWCNWGYLECMLCTMQGSSHADIAASYPTGSDNNDLTTAGSLQTAGKQEWGRCLFGVKSGTTNKDKRGFGAAWRCRRLSLTLRLSLSWPDKDGCSRTTDWNIHDAGGISSSEYDYCGALASSYNWARTLCW